ncbi:PaaI family thioesterase [Reyranella sp. CPCC 100927]|uniref:PaaI family thioesterase n=1 Tax=Reyranella sp. CPCC 100927 TaxID=2599616 RepID=UPI0011B502FC|nr:PaaI family thioesterase [Reyranella sp. CPCC 100927]TWT05678.1 PaaI family thioesterase [Reyranella sp. CPCC 100927]
MTSGISDPGYADRVRASFARQAFMDHLGARLTQVEPGRCEVVAAHRPELTQQHGYFHGGVMASLADSAAGYAAYSLMPADSTVLTVEYKLNILRPGQGEQLAARAHVVKPGRTLTVVQADVFAVRDGRETLCLTSLQTLMRLDGQPDDARRG